MKNKNQVLTLMTALLLFILCSCKSNLPVAKRSTFIPALATVSDKSPEVELATITQKTEDLLLAKMTDEETASFQLMLMQYGSVANAERVMQKNQTIM